MIKQLESKFNTTMIEELMLELGVADVTVKYLDNDKLHIQEVYEDTIEVMTFSELLEVLIDKNGLEVVMQECIRIMEIKDKELRKLENFKKIELLEDKIGISNFFYTLIEKLPHDVLEETLNKIIEINIIKGVV